MCWLCRETQTDFMGTPRLLCSGALPACLGSALGEVMAAWEVVQGDIQVLCGRTGVGGVLRNPQATPFLPAALSTVKLTSLGSSGYKICSTEKNVSGITV